MLRKLIRIVSIITLLFGWPVLPIDAAPGDVLFVNPEGTGDCSDWDHACSLQTALVAASSGEEVWVAAGLYTPGTLRSDTFLLAEDVAVYGGFTGTETGRDDRDPAANLTVLSGDIDHNDSQTPVITDLNSVTGNTTNSYHVVTGGDGATLDGFTITAGYADGTEPDDQGGGMYNFETSPNLTNLVFSGNDASVSGGGLFNQIGAPRLTNVIFRHNHASRLGVGGGGGGMVSIESNPTLTHVIFEHNWTESGSDGGGLIIAVNSEPILTDVVFNHNWVAAGSVNGYGGGLVNSNNSHPILNHITFIENSADIGGGFFTQLYSHPTLTDVTFTNNHAVDGGGMYADLIQGGATMKRVTFRGNTAKNGGGYFVVGENTVDLNDVIFNSNHADNGAAIYSLGSNTMTMRNVTINNNSANFSGGGMYFYDHITAMLTNVTFSGNSADHGGAIYSNGCNDLTIRHGTLSGNMASIVGGGIYNEESESTLVNTILWNNTAPSGPQIHDEDAGHPTIVSDSVVEGGFPGGTNIITDDPLLGTLGYHGGFTQTIPLQIGSSAIDAANPAYCPATDQRNFIRPFDGDAIPGPICDIGAYELIFLNYHFFPWIARLP
ncbi:MAG: hypothetical protein JXR32_10815 [Anaerolineaceae bacterium]|nr:hypothetical protein [Anaerolineaceae bacterium]